MLDLIFVLVTVGFFAVRSLHARLRAAVRRARR